VAGEAVIGKDGTDVLIESDGLGGCGYREEGEKSVDSPSVGHRMLPGYTTNAI
jgi:hypothetical protein